MTGNGGADTFVFRDSAESAPGAPDRILDFVAGTARIDLARIDANSLADGNQAFSWIGSGAYGGPGAETAGELRACQSDSDWFVEGGAGGDGLADFVLQVTGPARPGRLPALGGCAGRCSARREPTLGRGAFRELGFAGEPGDDLGEAPLNRHPMLPEIDVGEGAGRGSDMGHLLGVDRHVPRFAAFLHHDQLHDRSVLRLSRHRLSGIGLTTGLYELERPTRPGEHFRPREFPGAVAPGKVVRGQRK